MKFKITLIALFLTTVGTFAQSTTKAYQEIVQDTDAIYKRLVDIRRDLHRYPEVSHKEERTAKIVAEYLKELGLEVKTGVGGHGVVGILKGGKKGRKIAWRADMDAVPTEEPDVVDFKSENEGVRHICGHDVHTTIALGIATVLSKQKEELKGTAYFIFQPAEEAYTGAKDMIKDGLFEMINPDEIYGLHIGPEVAGTINYKENELFAYKRSLKAKFRPNTNTKELETFMNTLMNSYIRTIESSSPWEIINKIGDPKIGITNKETIFKDYFILEGAQLYTEDNGDRSYNAAFLETNRKNVDNILEQIKTKIIASKFKGDFISIAYTGGLLTPINDPKLTAIAAKTMNNFYGNERVQPLYGQVPYFSEDFIFYQQKVPGVFFFLGGSNPEKGIISMPHSPNFAVDESTIKYGVQCFSSLLMERING